MIQLSEILKALGPGYWVELRYFNDGLEFNLYYRYSPTHLLIRKVVRFTDEILKPDKANHLENALYELSMDMQNTVNKKMGWE